MVRQMHDGKPEGISQPEMDGRSMLIHSAGRGSFTGSKDLLSMQKDSTGRGGGSSEADGQSVVTGGYQCC